MATKKFTVPNWGQTVIARALNLDPKNVAVEQEDDRHITFLQYMPRVQIMVCKATGTVIRS
jgi:hypothetical protein